MSQGNEHTEGIPPEMQEVIRAVMAAVRAVRLYPSNNPVYVQSVRKSYEVVNRYLAMAPECRFGVQKTDLTYQQSVLGGDTHLHRGIAGDLYAKGVREIVFTPGLTETELLDFYTVISSPLDIMHGTAGLESLLWEKDLRHAVVRMASLGEVVRQHIAEEHSDLAIDRKEREEDLQGRSINLFGNTVMLSDIVDDAVRFGTLMLEQAQQRGGSMKMQTDCLFDSYRQAGRQVVNALHEKKDSVFHAMAASILAMDPAYREELIAKRLYAECDKMTVENLQNHQEKDAPYDLHEVLSSRLSRIWTVPQVSALLVKTSIASPSSSSPQKEQQLLAPDLYAIAREMSEYTPEEMESLRSISNFGVEADILEAVARTLIYALPMVYNPFAPLAMDRALGQFSCVVSQLEEVLSQLLERKDYILASLVVRSFRIPVPPAFRTRLAEAVKRAGDKRTLIRLVADLRTFSRPSEEYEAAYSYLSLLDREATPVLLEMLAEEDDRPTRKMLIQVLKDLGKSQIAMLGERLSDERWYFVRNIVSILGESKGAEVISYLEKVAGHRNFQIRQEVVRALVSIGGVKTADLLIGFLRDEDIDIRFMALRGLGSLSVAGERVEQALISFLRNGWMKKINPELKLEAIGSLARVGGENAASFLVRFTKMRWWHARKPQKRIIAAARHAIHEIERRLSRE